MGEKELKVKTTFEKFIQVTLIRLKKLHDITFDEIPEVELVIEKNNVYNSKDTFEVYINTFNSEGSINEKFESVLRETCRFVQLFNEYNTQLYFNTDVPERYESLVSSSNKIKTELENYFSGYDSDVAKIEVEYVKPENANWQGGNSMVVNVIINLYLQDPNDDSYRKAGKKTAEKTAENVLGRIVNRDDSEFDYYSLHINVEEMDNNINEIAQMSTELSENKVKNFFTKHSSSIKKTFLEELKNSGDDAKSAYSNLMKLVNSGEPISKEEREKIGNELKGVFKRTMVKVGMAGIFLLPGGTVFLFLLKLFKNKKSKTEELPFDEVNEGAVKIRTFSESTNSDEFKWHRDRENRKVTVIEGQSWRIQFDNELPQDLIKGQEILIPEGVYHRVIKGNGSLKVSIEFI